MFTRGLARDGERAARRVVLDDTLRVLLAQTVRDDTRRVDPVRGRVVDYLRCWYDDFQYGDVAGASVPVKLVVADCSVVFAYVRGRWITCRLADGDLHGRSRKQGRMGVEELRARRRQGRAGQTVNAGIIGTVPPRDGSQGGPGPSGRAGRGVPPRASGTDPRRSVLVPPCRARWCAR